MALLVAGMVLRTVRTAAPPAIRVFPNLTSVFRLVNHAVTLCAVADKSRPA